MTDWTCLREYDAAVADTARPINANTLNFTVIRDLNAKYHCISSCVSHGQITFTAFRISISRRKLSLLPYVEKVINVRLTLSTNSGWTYYATETCITYSNLY